jgi:hypothetical protein
VSKELDELREIAKTATKDALKSYERPPKAWQDKLTLGTIFDGEDRVFELYVPGERPTDAIVISSARVNSHTRAVSVQIFNLPPLSNADQHE